MQSTIFYTFKPKFNSTFVNIRIYTNHTIDQSIIKQLITDLPANKDVLVEGKRNVIKKASYNGAAVTIKQFKRLNFLKAIIYTYFRENKAKRSFEYAAYLLEHGILTPKPYAYVEVRNALGLLSECYYVCELIRYDFTIREIIHDPLFPDREKVLEGFTEFSFKLHEADVNFLDHSPGNTLIVKDGDHYKFYLIDLNRMKFQKMSLEDRMNNLKKLWFSKDMIRLISKKYEQLSGLSATELSAELLKKTNSFKKKIYRKKYLKRKLKGIF